MCETVVSRLVPGPVRHQRAVGYAILRESDPAGGHAFAEAAILVVDGAGERSEIAQRPENIGNFGAMPGALRPIAARCCNIVEMTALGTRAGGKTEERSVGEE